MKVTKSFIAFIIIVVIIAGIVIWSDGRNQPPAVAQVPVPVMTSTSTASAIPVATSTTQTFSEGAISFTYPSAQFALATSAAQVSVKSVIPPCDNDFKYCIYYDGAAYQGTNLESAGVTVNDRSDLVTEAECLDAGPNGYTGLTPVILPPNALSSAAPVSPLDYATSLFANVGDAAAGSYSTSDVYRLWYKGSPDVRAGCYEFETRIGQSEYGNYPAGSIQEFTAADQAAVQAQLTGIVQSVMLPGNEQTQFPAVPASGNKTS